MTNRPIDFYANKSYDAARGDCMFSYKEIYLLLFNAITDALHEMERQNCAAAKDILIQAQQDAEELYISANE